MINSITKPRLSVKKQTLYAAVAVFAAVALPQIVHMIGKASGFGAALGEALLPMHLPIILVGFLAGSYAGAVSGFIAPIISFALSGMPSSALLPFMAIELCAYGLIAGILRTSKLPVFVNLIIAQIGGRLLRAAVICFAVYVIGSSAIPVSIIWTSITAGFCGIILQWLLIPMIVRITDNR